MITAYLRLYISQKQTKKEFMQQRVNLNKNNEAHLLLAFLFLFLKWKKNWKSLNSIIQRWSIVKHWSQKCSSVKLISESTQEKFSLSLLMLAVKVCLWQWVRLTFELTKYYYQRKFSIQSWYSLSLSIIHSSSDLKYKYSNVLYVHVEDI